MRTVAYVLLFLRRDLGNYHDSAIVPEATLKEQAYMLREQRPGSRK